jgi:hypothetical protein
MVAATYTSRRQQYVSALARAFIRLRIMPSDSGPPRKGIDWDVALNNGAGVAVGLVVTAAFTSLIYLAYRLPTQQDELLQGQRAIRDDIQYLTDRLKRVEDSERSLNTRVTRLEAQ